MQLKSFKSFIYPSVINLLEKSYIVPNWIEVPHNTTINDIIDYWIPIDYKGQPITIEKKYKQNSKPLYYKVLSSNKIDTYTITVLDKNISCNCPGFKFRHNCKHIKAFLND